MHKQFEVTGTKAYPPGVYFGEDGMHIVAVCGQEVPEQSSDEFGIILYDKKHKNGVRIPFPEESRVGAVRAMLLKGYYDRECRYLFYCGEQLWQDPYCKKVENTYRYGTKRQALQKCMICGDDFAWESDRTLELPFEDMILYALHVRGFTKHKSSGVKYKGTYNGIVEKIPYLKELGVTSLLLMPAYEFDEVMPQETAMRPLTMEQALASYKQPLVPSAEEEGQDGGEKACRVNYWGYQRGLYYMPKGAYACSRDAVTEYKSMVKELHKNGLEVLMQFYFPPEIEPVEMLDILKYWVLEYHIDGFHVMGVNLPVAMFDREPLLATTKILTTQQYDPVISEPVPHPRHIGLLSESFLYDMRKALKGDDNMINQLLFHVRNNRYETGVINYIAKWDGMRLVDMVSYDRKHNEANGEDNQDGTDYNCSWNCGAEGKSRRKNIAALRLRQMKNALSFVFLSQGTPLLYSGDEFGNTQEGNNNPYCQDNAVTWIKWNHSETGRQLLEYTRRLIALRKRHPILHSVMPLRGMDYLSCGYPDISFHGREAWRPDTGPACKNIGIMYCGAYGMTGEKREDGFFYIGINLHWNAHHLGLPQLPKGKKWKLYAATDSDRQAEENMKIQEETENAEPMLEVSIAPRTVAVYTAVDCAITPVKPKKSRSENGI